MSVVILWITAACTVHQSDQAPPLAGPSTFAQSINVTATPDLMTQDGQSQSAISVRVFDANGQPVAAVPVRVDILVGGTLVDYGTLSTKNIVTGTDGRATTVYTAPPAPPPTAQTSNTVTIRAAVIGTDAPGSAPFSAQIRLVPPGVIQPPAETPTPSFTVFPASPAAAVPAQFDGSTSCGGALVGSVCQSGSRITSYAWTFGDGTSGSGATTSHTYSVANSYTVTLTVTNDRGVSASLSKAIAVVRDAALQPTAQFTFSPTLPYPGDQVFFNAVQSTAGAGHTLVSYQWSFGDGLSGAGQMTSHVYAPVAAYPVTFTVTLTVTDEAGQTASTNQTITINKPATQMAR